MLSVVVPAHNEAPLIGATLRAIHDAASEVGQAYEIVVVDDVSTDATAALAAAHGARVVRVALRHIAAVRNAGARAARGQALVFVDADTRVSAAVLQETVAALQAGAAGGGAWTVRFDGRLSWPARAGVWAVRTAFRLSGMTFGCFMFCTRAAFDAMGGFDETLFAAEEVAFSRGIRRHGDFVLVRAPVVTSGRKFRTYTTREIAGIALRMATLGPFAIRRRERLPLWYGPRRHDVDEPPR